MKTKQIIIVGDKIKAKTKQTKKTTTNKHPTPKQGKAVIWQVGRSHKPDGHPN